MIIMKLLNQSSKIYFQSKHSATAAISCYCPRAVFLPPAIPQGFFSGVSGAEIRPHSQCNLGDFFPNWKKKNSQSKLIFFF